MYLKLVLRIVTFSVSLSLVSFIFAQGKKTLSLGEYINQVREKNESIASLEASIEASKILAEKEADLQTAANLVLGVGYSDNRMEQMMAALEGEEKRTSTYKFGLSKSTDFGLETALSYNFNYVHRQRGMHRLLTNAQTFSDGALILSLKQSLWKNSFGELTRAKKTQVESSRMATYHQKKFLLDQNILNTELVYWRLSLAKMSVTIQQESLARAKQIMDWNEKRVEMRLADKADHILAQANYQSRALALKTAEDNVGAVSREFNSLRGVDSSEVLETLETISFDKVKVSAKIKKKERPDDLVALEHQTKMTQAASIVNRDASAPDLNLQVGANLTGWDHSGRETLDNTFSTQYPKFEVSLNFAAPIERVFSKTIPNAYSQEILSAKLAQDRANFEDVRKWREAKSSYEDAKDRYEFQRKLQKIQKEKLTYEKDRLYTGKTTTYQVLQYEIDYATAQLGELSELMTIAQAAASIKLLGE